jgi:hypothetical protein
MHPKRMSIDEQQNNLESSNLEGEQICAAHTKHILFLLDQDVGHTTPVIQIACGRQQHHMRNPKIRSFTASFSFMSSRTRLNLQ